MRSDAYLITVTYVFHCMVTKASSADKFEDRPSILHADETTRTLPIQVVYTPLEQPRGSSDQAKRATGLPPPTFASRRLLPTVAGRRLLLPSPDASADFFSCTSSLPSPLTLPFFSTAVGRLGMFASDRAAPPSPLHAPSLCTHGYTYAEVGVQVDLLEGHRGGGRRRPILYPVVHADAHDLNALTLVGCCSST